MTINYNTLSRVLGGIGFVSMIIGMFFVQVAFFNEHDLRMLLAENVGALAVFFAMFGFLCFLAGGLYNHLNIRIKAMEDHVRISLDNALEELEQMKKRK